MKTYLCSYRFRDSQWSLEIPADSEAEAYLRLQAIGSSGQVDGVLKLSISVSPSWLWRFFKR